MTLHIVLTNPTIEGGPAVKLELSGNELLHLGGGKVVLGDLKIELVIKDTL